MGDKETELPASLIPRLCSTILHAPRSGHRCLTVWWSEYPAALLETRVVRPLQEYLTAELYQTKKLTTNVMNVIKVLELLEAANQLGRLLPPEALYNELIRYTTIFWSCAASVVSAGLRSVLQCHTTSTGIECKQSDAARLTLSSALQLASCRAPRRWPVATRRLHPTICTTPLIKCSIPSPRQCVLEYLYIT